MAVIATIDEEKRLILSSKRHDLSWFDESEDFRCVVEVKARGLVKLQELKRWADREGLTEEVANATLA